MLTYSVGCVVQDLHEQVLQSVANLLDKMFHSDSVVLIGKTGFHIKTTNSEG